MYARLVNELPGALIVGYYEATAPRAAKVRNGICAGKFGGEGGQQI